MTSGPRILLIEDGETYAALATMLLGAIGCTVVRAKTAEDGLRLAREEPPDLILMDLNLPRMDGYTAVRELRQDRRTRRIPTVALSADPLASEEEQGRARDAGFDASHEKPIDKAAFRAIVEPFLKAR